MKSRFVRRILKLGPLMWNLVVSTAGCFVLISGFSQVTTKRPGSYKAESVRAAGKSRKPLVAVGAALFLLAFVASEALAMLGVFRH
jgi:hypothetical protein